MTTLSDAFTGADLSDLVGTTAPVGTYSGAGTWPRVSNKATSSAGAFPGNRLYFDAGDPDPAISCTFPSNPTGAAGVLLRHLNSNNFVACGWFTDQKVYLLANIGGTVLTWDNVSVGMNAAGHTLTVEAVTNVYTVKWDGSTVITFTDTGGNLLTETNHGLITWVGSGELDNLTLEVADIDPGQIVEPSVLDVATLELVSPTVVHDAFVLPPIVMAPAVRGPYAWGPYVSLPGTVEPDLVAVVSARGAPETVTATLDQSYSKRFLDQLNEAGSGTVVLQNDDPDLPSIGDGDLITFKVHGFAAFTMLAQGYTRQTIAPNEEADQATSIDGPGNLAVLEEAVVYPARGAGSLPAEESRSFNWTSVDYDDSGWGAAEVSMLVDTAQTSWPLLPFADGFPASSGAALIWDRPGADTAAPPGDCYFRRTYTVTTGGALIYAVIDDGGEVYYDGQLVLSCAEGFAKVYTVAIQATPGDHTVAVHAQNGPGAVDSVFDNPAGVAIAIYPCDVNGQPTSSTPDVATGVAWRIVAYPPHPPGMTPGEVIRHCVLEAQARGALLGVTLDFTDDVDSEGVAWPEVTDISTTVGNDVLTFCREISATYVDFAMNPMSLTLRAWVRDGRGDDSGVSYHGATDPADPMSGNLATLTHQRGTAVSNSMLVRWAGGWRERARTVDEGLRREALLGIGASQSTGEVDRITDSQLDIYADPRVAITVDIVPVDASDTPYLSCLVGDTVSVPGWDGEPSSERVLAITTSEDELGVVTFALEVKDILLQQSERFEQWVKKMANGTMRGDSKVASPVASLGTSPPNCCPPTPPGGGA